jgi:hypothetical protein
MPLTSFGTRSLIVAMEKLLDALMATAIGSFAQLSAGLRNVRPRRIVRSDTPRKIPQFHNWHWMVSSGDPPTLKLQDPELMFTWDLMLIIESLKRRNNGLAMVDTPSERVCFSPDSYCITPMCSR